MTQENEFKFGRKFDVSKDDQSDDQTKGTFTLGSTSFNGWTTTAHSTFAAVAEQNAFEGISFSEIESWFKDPRIPGGITIDRDAIRSDFSILYFLVDIKDLFFGFRHWIPQLRKLRGSWSASRKGMTAKAIVDGHLQYQFGLVATWHDIVQTIQAFQRLVAAAEDLKRISSVLHKYRVKPVTLQKSKTQTTHTTTTIGGLVYPVRRRIVVSTPRLWHGTCYYTFQCEPLQGLLKRIKYFVDLFGVFDAAAAWDVIPWSFVVDWFVDVGGWLHDHSPKLYPVDVSVKDYCESLKTTVDVKYVLGDAWVARKGTFAFGEPTSDYIAYPGDGEGGLQFAHNRYTYYTRRRFIPNVRMGARGLSLGDLGRVGFRRVAIATSLVAQRVPRSKPWSDDFNIVKDIEFGDRVSIRKLGRLAAPRPPSGGIRTRGNVPRQKA